ncbi:methyl-CpG-binding domain protein 6-like isoform X2 [Phalacrocorax carbo]|uniref:methyl-CpG-binding domain protein 6-like isoform X2 n=1 Tax=Phalacrocorax carbo TaxID=9209 RepID=UPI00311987B5
MRMPSLPAPEEREVERGWMDPRGTGVTVLPRNGERDKGKGPRRGDQPRRASGIAASQPDPGELPPRHHAKENTGNPIPSPPRRGPGVYPGGEAGRAGGPEPRRRPIPSSSRSPRGRMALVLGAVLLAAGAAVPPGLPAPRDLARSVLETHGQELRLLKLLGVARTTFDWGTHFSINFTARQPACPKTLADRRGAGCQTRPGRVQRCTAQVSVFAFLPDVPLSMVECGRESPSSSTQPRSPGTLRAFGTSPGRPSSSSQPPPRPRPPAAASLPGTPRGPLTPAGLE